MEDEFAALYRRLIDRIEPDPDRLRQGLQALCRAIAGPDPPNLSSSLLQSPQKYDIPGAEAGTRSKKSKESEKRT